MLPIFSSEQIKAWDQFTIDNQAISSFELMQRASNVMAQWLVDHLSEYAELFIFCGNGNNGGDGLFLAEILVSKGFSVQVCVFPVAERSSEDFLSALSSLQASGFKDFIGANDIGSKKISNKIVFIDALLGSGINRSLEGPIKELVIWMNAMPNVKISIDLPSGMFANPPWDGICIQADITLTLGSPKLTALLPDTGTQFGILKVLDIGLSEAFMDQNQSMCQWIEKNDVLTLLKARKAFDYKNRFGHVQVIGGGPGMAGALLMAGRAALRSGCGLCTLVSLEAHRAICQSNLPEAMFKNIDESFRIASTVIAAGPGMGQNERLVEFFKERLNENSHAMVVDADALNALDPQIDLKHKSCGLILTPHVGEFDRLFGKSNSAYERLQKAVHFSIQFGCYIVLKGHFTAICCPDGNTYFNSTGNSGLAKGGSGDVLCGMIAALVAQSYSLRDACLIGTYVHGLVADTLSLSMAKESMMASDLVETIPHVLKKLWDEKEAGGPLRSWNEC